jgi:hypothetical protein
MRRLLDAAKNEIRLKGTAFRFLRRVIAKGCLDHEGVARYCFPVSGAKEDKEERVSRSGSRAGRLEAKRSMVRAQGRLPH